MGIIARLLGRGGASALGSAVTNVAEVFTPNATRRMELGHEAFVASVTQHGTEFTNGGALLSPLHLLRGAKLVASDVSRKFKHTFLDKGVCRGLCRTTSLQLVSSSSLHPTPKPRL